MTSLLVNLKQDFPGYDFVAAKTFYWSPSDRVVHYRQESLKEPHGSWSLLHELSHGLLNHANYESDFELLQMEVDAWERAKKLAAQYNINIDADHIEDCIDTYRDWLYQRSTCPTCTNCSLQTDHRTYRCLNCGTSWHVSASRLCRPYRRKKKEALATASASSVKT